MNTSVIKLFKVVVAPAGALDLSNAQYGFVTDFTPTVDQEIALRSIFTPLPIVSLFSVEERANASIEELISKQILHYIEVYGLDAPGLFNLEVKAGSIFSLSYIKAVTTGELTELVHGLIYANRPIADIPQVVEVIRDHKIKYDINKVANNELRIALFDGYQPFTSGDDAVRYMCYHATDKPLLIKSEQVISAVKAKPVDLFFLSQHVLPLAQVFNRHQRIIMAAKNPKTRTIINRISRLSKTAHVPIREAINKRYISEAIRKNVGPDVLDQISLRDKFKYLNLIEHRLLGLSYDSFTIRNGKIWVENDRKTFNKYDLYRVRSSVFDSIGADLSHLKTQKVLLDGAVQYGLPISRKQALGNLPFGTKVIADMSKKLSAGIYWRNDWGKDDGSLYNLNSSIDLDLSAIDDDGERTGWGAYSGYSKSNPITFSGDMTDATHGATEFMVVDPAQANKYGLMVNVFRGPDILDCEVVVGYPSDKVWQDKTIIREMITLSGKQAIIGFLKDNTYVVYSGKLSNSRVSKGKHPIIDRGLGTLWTVNDLLTAVGVAYDVIPAVGVVYDHDLTYSGFTPDKLEALLGV